MKIFLYLPNGTIEAYTDVHIGPGLTPVLFSAGSHGIVFTGTDDQGNRRSVMTTVPYKFLES